MLEAQMFETRPNPQNPSRWMYKVKTETETDSITKSGEVKFEGKRKLNNSEAKSFDNSFGGFSLDRRMLGGSNHGLGYDGAVPLKIRDKAASKAGTIEKAANTTINYKSTRGDCVDSDDVQSDGGVDSDDVRSDCVRVRLKTLLALRRNDIKSAEHGLKYATFASKLLESLVAKAFSRQHQAKTEKTIMSKSLKASLYVHPKTRSTKFVTLELTTCAS